MKSRQFQTRICCRKKVVQSR